MPPRGPNSWCCKSCTTASTSAKPNRPTTSTWPNPFRVPSTEFFGRLAGDLHIVLVTSLFERRAPGLYHNTAVVFDTDGSMAGKYRKMHIPDDPAYYEKFYFTPGDLGFKPIQTSIGTLGVLVCWDQWYPEAARLMALQGADLLIYPTAIGWESSDTPEEQKRQQDAWIISQRGHAVANGLPVIAVNRVGHEPDPSQQTRGIQFWGHSFVCGPQGEILAAAPSDNEWCQVVEVDLGPQRECAPLVALPARPPHRCLRQHITPLYRLITRGVGGYPTPRFTMRPRCPAHFSCRCTVII